MTTIEWVKGDDGSDGMSWNAMRAIRLGRSAHHCEHVNEACRFCYAERLNPRLGGLPFKPGHRKDYQFVIDEKKLLAPVRRRKPTRIFVESMSDAFGEWWPDEFIDKLYAVMALTPQHTYINLSKRPERRRRYLHGHKYLPDRIGDVGVELALAAKDIKALSWDYPPWPLPNVIEGTSVSCQEEADEFIPILLNTNAAIRCVSCEPLLGPIDLGAIPTPVGPGLNWIICGGESGPSARPMQPDWARSLRDQCQAAGVPFHFKQWGEWVWAPDDLNYQLADQWAEDTFGRNVKTQYYSSGHTAVKVGKGRAGRMLDGREWNGFPAMSSERTKVNERATFSEGTRVRERAS